MRFEDGTSTALNQILPEDYFLDVDALMSHIVASGPPYSSDTPRVIALGQGKDELLKVTLELGDDCQKKKVRPLALSYVYLHIDFSKDGEDIQNDVPRTYPDGYTGNNQPSNRNNDRKTDLYVNVGDKSKKMDGGSEGGKFNSKNQDHVVDSIPRDQSGIGTGSKKKDVIASSEAQQQPVRGSQRMTPLEIGMYVLLGVFCLAIVVFLVNCMVFVVRYRRKRKPRNGKDPVSNVNDWVWIGRATLERNSINTQCSQALMSDADFNGNHNIQMGTLGQAASQGTSSGAGPSSNRNSNTSSGSNRNSMVSTYKGSECSIRITANPLLDGLKHDEEDVIEEDLPPEEETPPPSPKPPPVPPHGIPGDTPQPSTSAASAPPAPSLAALPPIPPPPAPPADEPIAGPSRLCHTGLSDLDLGDLPMGEGYPGQEEANRDVGCAQGEETLRRQRREALQQALVESIRAQQDSANGNISEAEWDYEAMGMSYEQLMEYFDNLKESTA